LAQDREGFPKRARLTKHSEFLNLARGRGARKIHTPHFVVLGKANDKRENRLGITVSSKVGKAVIRNRIKRLLREFFRRRREALGSSQDTVIIAKKGAGDISFNQVVGELSQALASRGSLKKYG
jgi:ribonuclease P protein component